MELDPPATDEYIAKMDQHAFSADRYRDPAMADITSAAKDLVTQLRDKYNSGDADVQAAVKNWGMNSRIGNSNWAGRGDKLGEGAAWELFYQAHQRYIGSRLQNEDRTLTPHEQELLSGQHGFDMGGHQDKDMFDFQSLIDKGKLKFRKLD